MLGGMSFWMFRNWVSADWQHSASSTIPMSLRSQDPRVFEGLIPGGLVRLDSNLDVAIDTGMPQEVRVSFRRTSLRCLLVLGESLYRAM